MIAADDITVTITAYAALLILSGTVGAPVRAARRLRRDLSLVAVRSRGSTAGGRADTAIGHGLSPIELVLVAELNLELARAHDEVASNPSNRDETRETAREAAAALRQRADLLRSRAADLSANPVTAVSWSERCHHDPPYLGSERRKAARRTSARRAGELPTPGAVGGPDRRMETDRRRRERRRRALAAG
jgi:hypothetical protein